MGRLIRSKFNCIFLKQTYKYYCEEIIDEINTCYGGGLLEVGSENIIAANKVWGRYKSNKVLNKYMTNKKHMIQINDTTKIINSHDGTIAVIPKMFIKILNIQKKQPLYIYPNKNNTLTIQTTTPTNTKTYKKMSTRTLGGSHILTIPKTYAQQTNIKIGDQIQWNLNIHTEHITITKKENTQ